ncbi:MAG: glycosyltransferase family 2 protein [Pseudomonadota bacterium]
MSAERYLILTCMKNEGPFILEWVAYHLSIGFDHILAYSNDCEDGTDRILDRLEKLGHVTHRDNARLPHQRPAHQVRAYRKARREECFISSDWVAVIDADEFINIHAGNRSIQALTAAAPDARCISLTWRLFGSSDQTFFEDGFLTEKLLRAAPAYCPSPMQAWGMKSMHRTDAVELIGCHRPKRVPDADWHALNWVNGRGEKMPEHYHNGSWRMTKHTAGYDLGQINHYALRTRENYLMKVARGRAYTPDMLGADYWHKMNRNEERDITIQPLLPEARAIYQTLLDDPVLHKLHLQSVDWHRSAIAQVRDTDAGRALMDAITPTVELFGRDREAIPA